VNWNAEQDGTGRSCTDDDDGDGDGDGDDDDERLEIITANASRNQDIANILNDIPLCLC